MVALHVPRTILDWLLPLLEWFRRLDKRLKQCLSQFWIAHSSLAGWRDSNREYVRLCEEGLWTTAYQSESIDGGFGQPYAVGEASGTSEVYPNRWLFPVPSVSSMLVGTGAAIVSSVLRSAQTNAPSISYAFIEDLNGSGRIEAGDNFMVVEYQISGNQWTTNTLARIPINASAPAQSFALASANFLPYETNILLPQNLTGNFSTGSQRVLTDHCRGKSLALSTKERHGMPLQG